MVIFYVKCPQNVFNAIQRGLHQLNYVTTVEPLYSGHHRDLEKVSAVKRCPLSRGFL